MKQIMANRNLQLAKSAKNDEFYTQYQDIQREVEKYIDYEPNVFRGKVVYCNCDDPFESNFLKYFANKFKSYGIKKLITTSYVGSPIAQTQLQLPGIGEFSNKKELPERKNKKATEELIEKHLIAKRPDVKTGMLKTTAVEILPFPEYLKSENTFTKNKKYKYRGYKKGEYINVPSKLVDDKVIVHNPILGPIIYKFYFFRELVKYLT